MFECHNKKKSSSVWKPALLDDVLQPRQTGPRVLFLAGETKSLAHSALVAKRRHCLFHWRCLRSLRSLDFTVPDPELRGCGVVSLPNFFGPSGLSLVQKEGGLATRAPPLDLPLLYSDPGTLYLLRVFVGWWGLYIIRGDTEVPLCSHFI